MDKDDAIKLYDDPLGKVIVEIASLKPGEKIDSWFTLTDVKSGQIHLKLKYTE